MVDENGGGKNEIKERNYKKKEISDIKRENEMEGRKGVRVDNECAGDREPTLGHHCRRKNRQTYRIINTIIGKSNLYRTNFAF